MIPQVGCLLIRNNIAAVSFNAYLRENTKNIIKKQKEDRIVLNQNQQLTKESRKQGLTRNELLNMSMTNMNNKQTENEDDRLSIDSGARSYLMNTLGINVNALDNINHTLKGYDDMSIAINDNRNKQKNRLTTSAKQRPQSSKNNESALYTRKVMLDRLSSHKYALRMYKEHVRRENLNTEEAFIQLV